MAVSSAALDDLIEVALAFPQFKTTFLTTVLATTAKHASWRVGKHLARIIDVLEEQRRDPTTSSIDFTKAENLCRVLALAYGNPPADHTVSGFSANEIEESFERMMALFQDYGKPGMGTALF